MNIGTERKVNGQHARSKKKGHVRWRVQWTKEVMLQAPAGLKGRGGAETCNDGGVKKDEMKQSKRIRIVKTGL